MRPGKRNIGKSRISLTLKKTNVNQQFNHLNQLLIDQCSSLNKLLESMENTENAYALHSNSKLYEDMIKSMRDLRTFSQDYISAGKELPNDKLGEAAGKLKTVENRVKDYLDNRTKVSYSHKAGAKTTTLGSMKATLWLLLTDVAFHKGNLNQILTKK